MSVALEKSFSSGRKPELNQNRSQAEDKQQPNSRKACRAVPSQGRALYETKQPDDPSVRIATVRPVTGYMCAPQYTRAECAFRGDTAVSRAAAVGDNGQRRSTES